MRSTSIQEVGGGPRDVTYSTKITEAAYRQPILHAGQDDCLAQCLVFWRHLGSNLRSRKIKFHVMAIIKAQTIKVLTSPQLTKMSGHKQSQIVNVKNITSTIKQ